MRAAAARAPLYLLVLLAIAASFQGRGPRCGRRPSSGSAGFVGPLRPGACAQRRALRRRTAAGCGSQQIREPATASAQLEDVLASLAFSHLPVAPPADVVERLQLLNADPPVVLLPGFWPDSACEELISAAIRSGAMLQSSCTSNGVRHQEMAGLRTSSSLVLKPQLAARYGAEQLTRQLHRDLGGVLGIGAGTPPGAITGEYPQVVQYQRGQRFAEHEDAFPFAHAKRTNYQRRATLLVYLNSVAKGGRTSFPDLGLEVQPEQGSALLFFPAFADGRPDPRTRHAAEPAVDEKWIAQVWVGSALRGPSGTARAR